jgi:hypothetical protein
VTVSPSAIGPAEAFGQALVYVVQDYPSTILATPDLVAYYRLDEPSGATANDSGPNNHDGTYQGSPDLDLAGAISGNAAVDFENNTGYITVAHHADFSLSEITIEFWLKIPATAATGYLPVLAKKGYYSATNGDNYSFYVYYDSGADTVKIECYWGTGAGANLATTTAVSVNNDWHHYVITISDTDQAMRAYIDTVLQTTSTAYNPGLDSLADSFNTKPLTIGQTWEDNDDPEGSADGHLEAALDEVSIYGRVLSAAEVASHYAAASFSGGAQSISPSGIASEEAFGAPLLTLYVSPSGIPSDEAFGDPALTPGAVTISPTGIASEEAFGTALIQLYIVPAGIGSDEAFGNSTITPGAVTISPNGISSAEAFGDHVISPGAVTISPASISSEEAFGDHLVSLGGVIISPAGIASAEAFGDPTLSPGAVVIAPVSIDSLEAFGDHVLSSGFIVSPSGIPSEEAFGAQTLVPGAVTILPAGIGSAEAFGGPALQLFINPSAIPSEEAFGSPTLASAVVISPEGIISLEAFGSHTLQPGSIVIQPTGIASSEAFGLLVVTAAGQAVLLLDSRTFIVSIVDDRSHTVTIIDDRSFTED